MQSLTNQLWKLSNMMNMIDPIFFPNLHGRFKKISSHNLRGKHGRFLLGLSELPIAVQQDKKPINK